MAEGLDEILYCREQIRQAGDGREIAGYIIRLPDALVASHGAQLQLECAEQTFAAGVTFLQLREAALHAVRDAHGLIPHSIGVELELWRHTLSRYAASDRRELPPFMTEGQRAANSQG